jgi:hypothetical protein
MVIEKMFQWLNKQGVRSEEGYALQRMSRFYYHYVEDEHVLKVVVEPRLMSEDIFLQPNPAWEAPHENEQIPIKKISEIESRIGAALTFMGIRHTIRRA